jgi:antitoxin component of MazEF toxin-antitoxin module
MQTEMSKWGNSAAFRVPAALVQQSGIAIGTKMDIEVSEGRLILTPRKQKILRVERYARIIADLEKYGPDEMIDWGPDVGNEIVE